MRPLQKITLLLAKTIWRTLEKLACQVCRCSCEPRLLCAILNIAIEAISLCSKMENLGQVFQVICMRLWSAVNLTFCKISIEEPHYCGQILQLPCLVLSHHHLSSSSSKLHHHTTVSIITQRYLLHFEDRRCRSEPARFQILFLQMLSSKSDLTTCLANDYHRLVSDLLGAITSSEAI